MGPQCLRSNRRAGTQCRLHRRRGGADFSLAIRSDGTLAAWGDNTYGQINVPAGTFTAVTAGYYHSLAIRSDGTLVGWGRNDESQVDVPTGTFTAVAAGGYHSLAIRSGPIPTVSTWGLIVMAVLVLGTGAVVLVTRRGANIAPGIELAA
ncbi:MAG: IPTL-CTERM sorting domain-containing protein [Planctomycetes bacterium]|nr:IPTL-CTERM sorting domain-containing protein [Planctomycetota bacterium]MBI3833606.1 IPTL-CTERM sorting domain-containing protein [Planctomycetota bacterium]